MKFVEQIDNIEKTYLVSYDKDKLRSLLNEIVKNCSYEISGKFVIYNFGYIKVDFKNNLIISGMELPNGVCMYKNIKDIYPSKVKDMYSSYDAIAILGTKVEVPMLAYIIRDILADDDNSINLLFEYEADEELIPIMERIASLNSDILKISNFDFDRKINELYNLKKLCEKKKNKQYFNLELLNKYYVRAISLIDLQLVSEKECISRKKK